MHLSGHLIVSSNEGNVIKLPVLCCCCVSASRCETVPVSHWSCLVAVLRLGQVLLVRSKRENVSFGLLNILAFLMYQCQFLSFAASCTVCLQLCVRADSPLLGSETTLEYPELEGTHRDHPVPPPSLPRPPNNPTLGIPGSAVQTLLELWQPRGGEPGPCLATSGPCPFPGEPGQCSAASGGSAFPCSQPEPALARLRLLPGSCPCPREQRSEL